MITKSEMTQLEKKVEKYHHPGWEVTHAEKFDPEKHGVSFWEDGFGTPSLHHFNLGFGCTFEELSCEFDGYWITLKIKPSELKKQKEDAKREGLIVEEEDKGIPF